jgi:proteasome lid subunit RPN8/RPN11
MNAFPPSIERAVAHCEQMAPNEGVAAYVRRGVEWRFQVLRNVAPSPLTQFEIDPLQWMSLETDVLATRSWVCLVHGHPEAPAVLSSRDTEAFAVDGRPLLPRLSLVVVGLKRGRAICATGWLFREKAWGRVWTSTFDRFSLRSVQDLH